MVMEVCSVFLPDNTIEEKEARWKKYEYETAWKQGIFLFLCNVAQRSMHRSLARQIFLIPFVWEKASEQIYSIKKTYNNQKSE